LACWCITLSRCVAYHRDITTNLISELKVSLFNLLVSKIVQERNIYKDIEERSSSSTLTEGTHNRLMIVQHFLFRKCHPGISWESYFRRKKENYHSLINKQNIYSWGNYCTNDSQWSSFTVAFMSWLAATVYQCHIWPLICSVWS
jgi:hypothetical protein